jgi:hypothetical protein
VTRRSVLVALGALVLGGVCGAYGAATWVTACVDRVGAAGYCTTDIRPSAVGAVVGAVLFAGAALLASRRRSRRGQPLRQTTAG